MRRSLVAALALAAALPGPVDARILLVETPQGPVYKNFPEPAGSALPKPTARRFAFRDVIDQQAARHGLDPHLVEAVIACESNFDSRAVSSAGACGLMQLMPDTAKLYGLTDLFDVEGNVDAGCRHLAGLLASFGGDLELSVAAYNAGEGAVRRAGGIPAYPETRHYVRKVRHYLDCLGVTGAPSVPASQDASPAPVEVAEAAPERPIRSGKDVVMVRDSEGRLHFRNAPAGRRR